jgi:hypothetical protein
MKWRNIKGEIGLILGRIPGFYVLAAFSTVKLRGFERITYSSGV